MSNQTTTTPAVETAECRFCNVEQPVDREHFFQKRDGSFYTNSRCKGCEKTYRAEKKGDAAPAAKVARRETMVPVRIDRRPKGKKFAYVMVYADGTEVVHTAASGRTYEAASVYEFAKISDYDHKVGRQVGDKIVFLHSRQDLALKGSPDANRIVNNGGGWKRVPGVVEVVSA